LRPSDASRSREAILLLALAGFNAGISLRCVEPMLPRLAVEAAASFGWDRWADDSVSIDRFGASAPGKIVLEELGYTGERVAVEARALVARKEGVS